MLDFGNSVGVTSIYVVEEVNDGCRSYKRTISIYLIRDIIISMFRLAGN